MDTSDIREKIDATQRLLDSIGERLAEADEAEFIDKETGQMFWMPVENFKTYRTALQDIVQRIDHAVSPSESEARISEAKAWPYAKYGRQAELARELGVSRQLINDWFAGRVKPSLDRGLKLQAFLKKQRRAKSRGTR